MENNTKLWIGVGVALLVIVLVWGVIGGQEADKVGVDCEMGTDSLCWSWDKNILGEVDEAIEDATDNN